MSTGELLNLDPLELKFPFELKKQISCSLQLSNKTDSYVAFKVKTTNPNKYCVRPNTGVVLPRSTCDVIVTMQAQKEAPPDMQCKDKFLLQSVKTSDGATAKDITAEMFSKESGNVVEECKLRVVYVPSLQPPSPVPEGSDEDSSPRGSMSENGNANGPELASVTRTFMDTHDKSSEVKFLLRSSFVYKIYDAVVLPICTKATFILVEEHFNMILDCSLSLRCDGPYGFTYLPFCNFLYALLPNGCLFSLSIYL
ncbi:hypothetical protein SAY86_019505 [Trapa natans]|uniref:MSP domain-containing protein n=1 Tax=Trapa natans TaxID=22666 RepID=A0AAN7LL45_TRANT|nr:hypothetical protein SAY86_019505 [Trapa natans]